jgi:hypothetical protein
MQHKTETFTVKDRWGQPHEYKVDPSDPDDFIELAALINSFAVEPVAEGIQALTRSKEQIVGLVNAYMSGELKGKSNDELFSYALNSGVIEAVLGHVNISQITGAVRAGIMVPGMLSRIRPLFKMAFRDGKSLSQVTNYNEAFMRNYKELFEAAWRIMSYEGLFVFLDIASDNEAETTNSSTPNQLDSPESTDSTGGD